jgi:hypothetical protein
MAEHKETTSTLAQRAIERKERVNEPLNTETDFQDNPEQNISALARAAFPENPQEQKRYEDKITRSLRAHLLEGQSMESLWQYLRQNYCRTTAILAGLLRFFAGKKGENEIGIERFLKPFQVEKQSNLQNTKIEMHSEVVADTRTRLAELMAELEAQKPV